MTDNYMYGIELKTMIQGHWSHWYLNLISKLHQKETYEIIFIKPTCMWVIILMGSIILLTDSIITCKILWKKKYIIKYAWLSLA